MSIFIKRAIVLACVLTMVGSLFSQVKNEPIEQKKILGTVFHQNGKILSPGEMLVLMQDNQEAYQSMKIAKKNYVVGTVIGSIGGFLLGWNLGTAIGGGKPNVPMLISGAGLTAISIPFSLKYMSAAKKNVGIYNEGLKKNQSDVTSMNFGFNEDGIGIKLSF